MLNVTQFSAPNLEGDSYLLSITENLIEADFWNVYTNPHECEQEYLNHVTCFLKNEGCIWEAVELLDQFKLIEKESL